MPLSEVCNISIGEFIHKNYQTENGKYPVYNGGTSYTGFYEKYNQTANKIIISARGANAGYVNKVNVDFWSGNSCYSLEVKNKNQIDWQYLYYLLKKEEKYLMVAQQTGSIPAISKKQIENYVIPIPPIEEQERIVSILDKFDALVNDISIGLPAEINGRRQQYEYYRDKLLTFEEAA